MLRLRVWHGVSCSVLMHLKDGWEEQRHNPKMLIVSACLPGLLNEQETPPVVSAGVRWEHKGDYMD